MCRSVTPPRPVPTFGPNFGRSTRPYAHGGSGLPRHRDRHPSRQSRGPNRGPARLTDRDDADQQRRRRIHAAADRDRRAGTGAAGGGLARGQPQLRDRAGAALTAAGLLIIECEQPVRRQRRGKGKSDPIDAHLAVLAALRLDADRLAALRADGDREALRILLGARQELTAISTAQTNRLRALLRDGDDTDLALARGPLNDAALAAIARRREPRDASRPQSVRHAEIRRLALALRESGRTLRTNRAQLQVISNDLAPGL